MCTHTSDTVSLHDHCWWMNGTCTLGNTASGQTQAAVPVGLCPSALSGYLQVQPAILTSRRGLSPRSCFCICPLIMGRNSQGTDMRSLLFLAFLKTFYFETISDAHAVVRNDTDLSVLTNGIQWKWHPGTSEDGSWETLWLPPRPLGTLALETWLPWCKETQAAHGKDGNFCRGGTPHPPWKWILHLKIPLLIPHGPETNHSHWTLPRLQICEQNYK